MNRCVALLKTCILFVCVLLVLPYFSACSAQLTDPQPALLANISISPQSEDDAGVAYDSGFYIYAKARLTRRELAKNLVVEPEITYDLSATDDGFFLKPTEPLAPNTVYAFTLGTQEGRSRTWAFQSRRPFAVLSANIAPNATDVYPQTGIELHFSHPDVDPTGYVEISPAADILIESRGRTVTLYPKTSFKPQTRYTVTVKKGLRSPFDDILAEDYTLSFTTSSLSADSYHHSGVPLYLYSGYSETFLLGDVPVIRVGIGGDGKADTPAIEKDVSVAVYEFSGSSQYIQAMAERDTYLETGGDLDTYRYASDTLRHVVSFDTTLLTHEYWGCAYTVFPETLGKGWYLVNVTAYQKNGDTFTIQKLLQISDVSVYTQSVNGQTLVWLNDAASGKSIKGAGVGFVDAKSKAPVMNTTTDQNGLAQLASGDMQTGYLFAKADAENEFVEKIPLAAYQEPDISEQYYSFLYKDRELYMPDDTVTVWGRLAPRKDGVALPKTLTMVLSSTAWEYDDYRDETISEAPVALQPGGCFTAELSFESLARDGYRLRIIDENETEYCSTYLSIFEYEKPLYVLTTKSEKEFYTADDPVDFTLSAKFYNGTPVPGLSFETQVENTPHSFLTDIGGLDTLRINEDGHYFDDHTSWQPYDLSFYINSTGMEDQYISTVASAFVFPRDVMLTATQVKDGFVKELTLHTNRVDTSKLSNRDDVWSDFPSSFKGHAVNIPVDVKLYRVDYIKTWAGSYYHPVDRRTVSSYRYTRKETLENQYTVNTINGQAVLGDLPSPTSSEQFYRVELSYRDTKGRLVEQSEYLNYYEELYQTNDIKMYNFVNDKINADKKYNPYSYYSGYSETYSLGERVNIRLLEDYTPAQTDGTILYTLVQDGILTTGVSSSDTFSFIQNKQYLPNVIVTGAFFDGRRVYPVSSCNVQFDTREQSLKITAKTDKQTYRPGDAVTLELTTTNRTGAPVSADVSVSVVDEAMFTLAWQDVDPLASLYAPVYYYPIIPFASYTQYNFSGDLGGGKGGGGGPETGGGDIPKRDNFKDTAAALSAKTDANGKATLHFTLPDNLTSWRITTAAITDDLRAGATLMNIPTTLPLFVSPLYNTTYIEGDTVAFHLRAYGDALARGEDLRYTITVAGKRNRKEQQSLTVSPDTTPVPFDFGKLAAGDYKVTFAAQVGNEKDAVEYPFSVKESALEMAISRTVTPSEVSSVTAQKYPVWLGFYDKQYGEYTKTLEHLAQQYGERADQQTAVAVAAALLKEYADDEDFAAFLNAPETDFADFQHANGGVRLYSYEFSDVMLTARMAVCAQDRYDSKALADYLNTVIDAGWYDQTEISAAIMGLAALKQPVLTDAKTMLKRTDLQSELGILYLCLALAYLGDTDGAVAAYNTYIAPYIVSNEYWSYFDSAAARQGEEPIFTEDGTVLPQGSGKGSSIYTTAQTLTGTNLQHTALVMLLAQQTGCADTEALLRYVRENSSYDFSTLPEQTAYVSRFVPQYTDTAVVKFNRGLLPTTLELKKGGIRYIPFSKNQLAKANVAVTNGDVGITASYVGLPDALSGARSTGISVTKTIGEFEGGTLEVGELATITLTVTLGEDAPTGRYDISEWIPSALRYQSVRYGLSDEPGGIWLDAREGQRMTMSLYHTAAEDIAADGSPVRRSTYSISYTARCVTDGDSAIDSTYAVHTASGAANYTPKATLSVKEGARLLTLSSEQNQERKDA